MRLLKERLGVIIKLRATKLINGCIQWTSMKDSMGYAKAKFAPHWPKGGRVSRMLLSAQLGRIPTKDEWACYTCDNKLCVNTQHTLGAQYGVSQVSVSQIIGGSNEKNIYKEAKDDDCK